MECVIDLIQGYQNIDSISELQEMEVPVNTRMDNQTEWGGWE
jgi:hypothetical protein